MKLLLLYLAVVIFLFDLLTIVSSKGASGRGGGGHSGGGNHGQSKGKNHANEKSQSSVSKPSHPSSSHSSDTHKDEKDNKKDRGSSKSSLAGGLIGGGLLGYAAGRSHHQHKNASECDHKKRPSSINDLSCCPSMPIALVNNFTCECEEKKNSLNFCKLFCALEHNGWLGENNTIDSTLTSDSIIGRSVESRKAWNQIVPELVEMCIEKGSNYTDEILNETLASGMQALESTKCIIRELFLRCPREEKVANKKCEKLFNFAKNCTEYPFE